jgi:hypothetical protein
VYCRTGIGCSRGTTNADSEDPRYRDSHQNEADPF